MKTAIFEKLWLNYTTQNPSVLKVYNSFRNIDEVVENDHIAFRTFNDSRINIEVLAQVFLKAGYKEMRQYNFEAKKLNAKHYEIPGDSSAPRVFISELRVEEFSTKFQQRIRHLLDSIDKKTYQNPDLIFLGNIWGKPSFEIYRELKEESEYAAWLYVYGFCANHFTVSINALKKLNTIEKVNEHLKQNGFTLNSSGGEIKGTPDELLQQSSIMAERIPVEFIEGMHEIPGCYYEFAIRYPDSNGKLYNGFIAKSADKIFESTNNK